jgi:lipid II:glycine glycyltransferase (peptidoglycan interpeptide bridge formation enzyme)
MSHKKEYIRICNEHDEIPLFLQPWWLDAVCEHWDAAIAKKGDHVSGIWPYPIEKKAGVTLIRTPMFTPYLGPHIFFPHDIKDSNKDSFEHDAVAELLKHMPKAKVWHLALQPGMRQAGLFKSHKLQLQVQQTFLLTLAETEETLLANMKESTRRNIRMAETENTVTNETAYLKDLFKFHRETLGKKGKKVPYGVKDLERIMQACLAHDACKLWVAKDKKAIDAVVWQMWDKNCSYYFMGGHNDKTNSNRAMSLLLWQMIKEAKNRNHSTFDLEGSMDEGVERFFRNFGGNRALYMVVRKNSSIVWRLKQMIFK